jgi:hypothetical protein
MALLWLGNATSLQLSKEAAESVMAHMGKTHEAAVENLSNANLEITRLQYKLNIAETRLDLQSQAHSARVADLYTLVGMGGNSLNEFGNAGKLSVANLELQKKVRDLKGQVAAALLSAKQDAGRIRELQADVNARAEVALFAEKIGYGKQFADAEDVKWCLRFLANHRAFLLAQSNRICREDPKQVNAAMD